MQLHICIIHTHADHAHRHAQEEQLQSSRVCGEPELLRQVSLLSRLLRVPNACICLLLLDTQPSKQCGQIGCVPPGARGQRQ